MPKEQLHILLIDDDRDDCRFFKEALGKIDLWFDLAYSENVEDDVYYHLHNKNFHVIFLDINMPGEKGITFLKKLKENEGFRHIPVIMFTVSISDKDIQESYRLGAHHYLVKPYSEINLKTSLRKIFEADFYAPLP